jgi:hypothetical protein
VRTAQLAVLDGGVWTPADERCLSWPTCATATPTPGLAAGGIGVATVYRYVREALDLLAADAPPLDQAVYRASRL